MAKKKSKTKRKFLILSVIVLVLGGLTVAALMRKREVTITVQTEPVKRRNLTELVVANGRVFPVTQAVIAPEVSGEIVELPVKEGQSVSKGDLLLRIKPDNYVAARSSAMASYQSSLANRDLAKANLEKAEIEFKRNGELHDQKLISDSQYLVAKTEFEVMKASFETATHQTDQAKAALARAEDDLEKTAITAPMDGTVINLKSQLGERVVGTAMMAGTEVMTVANLDEMETRVDIGEMDIVLIQKGQKARLEVDAFKDRKFHGTVTEIANAARVSAAGMQAEATKFQVKIRIEEKEPFRPGMSVTAEVETRYRTNVLTVPIQSVTTRLPKGAKEGGKETAAMAKAEEGETGTASRARRSGPKPIEVVFLVKNGKAVMSPVERGISDDQFTELTSGVKEGEDVVSGSFKAINRELEDGKAVRVDNRKREPGVKENET